MTKPLVYIASPYSHTDAEIMELRFRSVCRATALIAERGEVLPFSPIAHSHPLVEYGAPTTWEYWGEFDLTILGKCDELWVLCLSGWQDSVGVTAEITFAIDNDIPVKYIYPHDYGLMLKINEVTAEDRPEGEEDCGLLVAA